MPPTELPRYCPSRPLPPYSHVPGLSPHPMSDARGHSFGREEPAPQPLDLATYRENAAYCYAVDLFNHGFYWEAHEAWEGLWHACSRRGPTADFLKGLIKLAAAGVKAREGRAAGVRRHARRAAELFREAARGGPTAAETHGIVYGLSLPDLQATAEQIAARSEELVGTGANVHRRLADFVPALLQLQSASAGGTSGDSLANC
jgi:uncharacterized protein